MDFGIWLTIGAIALALALYWRSLRDPVPRYVVWNSCLVDFEQGDDGLTIKVPGVGGPAQRMSLCHVLVWNAGRGPIRKADLASGTIDLRPQLGGLVLVAKMLESSRDACRAVVKSSRDHDRASVTFHHLNKGDWVSIRMLHTGVSTPTIEGPFVGEQIKKSRFPGLFCLAIAGLSAWLCATATAYAAVAESALIEAGVRPYVLVAAAPELAALVHSIGLWSGCVFVLSVVYFLVLSRRLPVPMARVLGADYGGRGFKLPN